MAGPLAAHSGVAAHEGRGKLLRLRRAEGLRGGSGGGSTGHPAGLSPRAGAVAVPAPGGWEEAGARGGAVPSPGQFLGAAV